MITRKFCLRPVKVFRSTRYACCISGGGLRMMESWYDREELILPEEIDGLPVTEIGSRAFAGACVKRIVLPETVRSIGREAFASMRDLQHVVIPESVKAIDETAFREAEDVLLCVQEGSYAHRFAQTMGLPFCFEEPAMDVCARDCFSIGDYLCALEEDGLTIREYNGDARKLVVPAQLKGYPVRCIGGRAFRHSPYLEELEVEEGVWAVAAFAFQSCARLRRVVLPGSLQDVGGFCFQLCMALEEVRFRGVMPEIPPACFELCVKLRSIELPESVRRVGNFAFRGCRSLESVVLPDGLRLLGLSSFGGCRSLHSINMPAGLRIVEYGAFRGCVSLEAPELPEEVKVLGDAFAGCIGTPEWEEYCDE